MGTGVISWSTTAATNATADSNVNFAEGQSAPSLNNSCRAAMASVALWREDLNGTNATTGGTTAYVLTSDQTFAALAAGLEVAFQINATNTGTTTLNVDSLGAKPLRSAAAVELVAGSLVIGAVYRATYFTSNSGEWLLHGVTPTVIAADQVVTASILDEAVTYAKIQDVSATSRVLGRKTSGAGVTEELTAEEVLNFVASSARGDILVRGESAWARMAKGLAGQVLTSDGTDTAWGGVPAIFNISSQTASSSASLDFTSSIDSTYRKYIFEIDNLLPATDDVALTCQVYAGGWKTSSYLSGVNYVDSGGTTSGGGLTTAVLMSALSGATVAVDNGAGYGYSGAVELVTPSNTTTRKHVLVRNGSYLRGGGSAVQVGVNGGGFWNGGNDAVTGIRFLFSSGNIASGTITMYGVA